MLAPNPYCQLASTPTPDYQSSEVKQKVNTFRVEIRNREIWKFKARMREDLIKVNHLEQMLESLPLDAQQANDWVSSLMPLYSSLIHFRLTPSQAVDLFRLVEKFPNRTTFQLLELVVFKADLKSIEEIFQYDIMRLLHSSINSCCQSASGPPLLVARSFSFEESDSIIREALDSNDIVVQKCRQSLDCFNPARSRLQFVETALRIIQVLCRKAPHIRNFAVINHKTFTYCLKASRVFGDSLKGPFHQLLVSFTAFQFEQNEEQFNRIANRIFTTLFGQNWQPVCHYEQYQMQALTCLLEATELLLKNRCGWVRLKLQAIEQKHCLSLFALVLRVATDFNAILLNHRDRVSACLCRLLQAAVGVGMVYEDIMEANGKGQEEEEGRGKMGKLERNAIYFQFASILERGKDVAGLQAARAGIYFMLCNHCLDEEVSNSFKHSLFRPDDGPGLLSTISNMLFLETHHKNIYELAYLLHSVYSGIPIHLIEPSLFPSEVLQNSCCQVLEATGRESDYANAKSILVQGMLVLMRNLEKERRGSSRPFRMMIREQFGNQFGGMVARSVWDRRLCEDVEQLLGTVGSEQ